MSRPTDDAASPPNGEAEAFHTDSLRRLAESGCPFLLAGTYAVAAYTGIQRPTKDLDVFCQAGDFPRIVTHFRDLGYEIEIPDERWLAKVKQGRQFFDIIFNSTGGTTPVGKDWFTAARRLQVLGSEVMVTSPTELIWSKAFVQDRNRYDGADIAHLILKQHDSIDWRRLLSHMEQYWEVLLVHLLNFRFIYPTERESVPPWLFEELVRRLRERAELPVSSTRICRGRLFSSQDYLIDVCDWGFADVVGQVGDKSG